jgi:hypothetical protein
MSDYSEYFECPTCSYGTNSYAKFLKHGQTHAIVNEPEPPGETVRSHNLPLGVSGYRVQPADVAEPQVTVPECQCECHQLGSPWCDRCEEDGHPTPPERQDCGHHISLLEEATEPYCAYCWEMGEHSKAKRERDRHACNAVELMRQRDALSERLGAAEQDVQYANSRYDKLWDEAKEIVAERDRLKAELEAAEQRAEEGWKQVGEEAKFRLAMEHSYRRQLRITESQLAEKEEALQATLKNYLGLRAERDRLKEQLAYFQDQIAAIVALRKERDTYRAKVAELEASLKQEQSEHNELKFRMRGLEK